VGDALVAAGGSVVKDIGSTVLNKSLGLKSNSDGGSFGERMDRSIKEGQKRGDIYMGVGEESPGLPSSPTASQQPSSPPANDGSSGVSASGGGASSGGSVSGGGASSGGSASGDGASGGGASGGGGE